MSKFYENIEYFQEEVVGKKDVPLSATDRTNILKDNEEDMVGKEGDHHSLMKETPRSEVGETSPSKEPP